MFDSQVAAFFLVVVVLTVTPGADTMLVIRNALRGGRTLGWATTLGIISGTLLHALMSAVGLSMILARSAMAFEVVKLAGAAYLIFLGLQALWASRGQLETSPDERPVGLTGPLLREGFLQGFVTNVLNPKVAVFYLAFLPQFIGPGDSVLAKSVLLASVHNVLGLVWLGGLSSAVARGRRWMDRPVVRRWVSRTSGAVLAGLGFRLVFED